MVTSQKRLGDSRKGPANDPRPAPGKTIGCDICRTAAPASNLRTQLTGAQPGDCERMRHFEALAAQYPGVRVDPRAFAAFVAPLAEASPAFDADLFLAFACARGDARAIALVEETILPKVLGAVSRLDPSPAFADEVCQALRERLFVGPPPQLLGYRGTGALTSWIAVAGTRLAIDLIRQRKRRSACEAEAEEDGFELAIAPQDAERMLLRARYGGALRDSIRHAFESISSRERAVLKLHAIDGASIDAIARVYGIHRATAGRWLQSVRETLRERTLSHLARALDFATGDAGGLVHSLFSEADVSLQRHLAEG
ncbi:MAG: sigma-70 family RNA polymerase sigma factor [Myxococcaceae bacterium]